MNKYNNKYIHLEDDNDVNYWVKKLGINMQKLNDAILHTGSTNIEEIKLHLRKQNDYSLSFSGLLRLVKSKF